MLQPGQTALVLPAMLSLAPAVMDPRLGLLDSAIRAEHDRADVPVALHDPFMDRGLAGGRVGIEPDHCIAAPPASGLQTVQDYRRVDGDVVYVDVGCMYGRVPPELRGSNAHGHGIGLELRDYPIVDPDTGPRIQDECIDGAADLPLEVGMVVNLELPLSLFGDGSLHVEQTFLIAEGGSRRLDSNAPTQPVRLSVSLHEAACV